MSKFKDASGRSWKIKLTIGTIKKVKDDTDLNLGKFLDDEMAVGKEVMGDPLQTFLVLWSLCESQAQVHGVDEEGFAELLYADVLDDARNALWEAFLDFCPSQQRKVLQTLMAKTDQMQDQAMEQLENLDANNLISFEKRTNVPASVESHRTNTQPAS